MHRGRGFVVVRGLKPEDFSQEENVILFLGLSSYIGPKRGRQDEEGNMLSECLQRPSDAMSNICSTYSGRKAFKGASRR